MIYFLSCYAVFLPYNKTVATNTTIEEENTENRYEFKIWAQMLKGGVIMDVQILNKQELQRLRRCSSGYGLERIPADIRAVGGVLA